MRTLVLSMPSDQNQARHGLLSYDFSFSWKETGTKNPLTFKINANQLENHLVLINEHSILSQSI